MKKITILIFVWTVTILEAEERNVFLKESLLEGVIRSDDAGSQEAFLRTNGEEIWSLTADWKSAIAFDSDNAGEQKSIYAPDLFDATELSNGDLLVLFSEIGVVKTQRLSKQENLKYEESPPIKVMMQSGGSFDVVGGKISIDETGFVRVRLHGLNISEPEEWLSVERIDALKSFAKVPSEDVNADVMKFYRAADSLSGLEQFLDDGFEINARNAEENDTILMIAARMGNAAMIDEIVRRGGKIGLKDKEGRDAFAWAVKNAQLESISKLAELGGKIGNGMVLRAVAYTNEPKLIAMLERLGADLDERDELDRTPLMNAAASGKTVLVKELMELGCKASVRTEKGKSALDFARERPRNTNVIELLQEKE